MSEPCSQSRDLRDDELAFILELLGYAGLESLRDRKLSVFPGKERMIAYSAIEGAKRKVNGGEYSDPGDGRKVYVDLLLSPDDQDFEVWFWKPMAGEEELAVPEFRAFRPDWQA